jgi:hypothetical protein
VDCRARIIGVRATTDLLYSFPLSTISLLSVVSLSEQPYAFQTLLAVPAYRNFEALLDAGGKLPAPYIFLYTIGRYFTIFGFKEQDGNTFDSHKSLRFLILRDVRRA